MDSLIEADIKWITNERTTYGVLTLNGAVLYRIDYEGFLYTAWLTSEENISPIYLWSFVELEDAKRYIEKREREHKAQYAYMDRESSY